MESQELIFAKDLAVQAGELLLRYQSNPNKIHYKNDSTPCTEADLASQQFILDAIIKRFPEDKILSEESNNTITNTQNNIWIIDPLDGTEDFIHKRPGFSVLIGLLKNNTPFLGVAYLPSTKKLYYAQQGLGSFVEYEGVSTPLKVSQISLLSKARCVLPEHNKDEVLALIASKAADRIFSGGFGSRIMKIVENNADFCISRGRLKIWDVCAPHLIIEEAGGKLTSLEGKPLSYSPQNILIGKVLATNSLLHKELLTFEILKN